MCKIGGMKRSAATFKNANNKRLTLLGMSGVGKTHLAKLLCENDQWFHYSGDYRIGSKYLNKPILDNIKARIKQDLWLKNLLENQSISIQNHITFDNLSSVLSFLGKVGNPELGGLPIDVFTQRQALHKVAEVQSMLDVEKFIARAEKQGIYNFINDAGGSLCELDDERVYQSLAKHSVILYIRASKANEQVLTERANAQPKPLYYQAHFLERQLSIYLAESPLVYVAQINPDDFVRWVFPRLLAHRKPKYEAIAQKYGYSINSEDLYACQNASDVFELIETALD